MDAWIIQPYDETHREGVLDVLAGAYATTPISRALVGDTVDQQRRYVRVLFELRLPTMSGEKLVAVHRGSVVGFAHWVRHPPMDASPTQPPSSAQSFLATLPESVLPCLTALAREWRRHDLEVPHSHLGPIAVAPSFQGMGIARRLLQRYCLDLDARNAIAYLLVQRKWLSHHGGAFRTGTSLPFLLDFEARWVWAALRSPEYSCTVFAESEVVSLIAGQADVREIVNGLHRAIATRTRGLVKRVAPDLCGLNVSMSGGVARNSGVIRALSAALGCEIQRPPEPDTVGALGAALIARDRWLTRETAGSHRRER